MRLNHDLWGSANTLQATTVGGYNAFAAAKSYIMKQIGIGLWAIGQFLPTEFELSDQLGVSRTIVREVIKVLQSQGVVEILRSKGTRIKDVEEWDLLDADVWGAAVLLNPKLAADLFGVRRLLEMQIVESASVKCSPDDVLLLEQILEDMKTAIISVDAQSYFDLDSKFHKVITDIADNAVMIRIYSMIRHIMNHTLEPSTILLHTPKDLERSFLQHSSILVAIRNHDPHAARYAMEEHLKDYENDVAVLSKSSTPQP